ncbi:PREDICTED: pre-rRNA processing protein FTSJ3-like [Acropora digitifera]|uniref:pre-rRNA processing protein FTSJ3-like n=1 Tax=Acropora digitifera TaxID=70779 RepID=UPI00077AF6B8|nr:PREDICTED: pre-rRNA processing protein FTSJ3-like [Acropora digitifera]
MGRKTKAGKQRKDKFYRLAKETGYRSRSAFKLIQLNRKFSFLQTSRCLIDLCAAPGGWLQVASKFMPISNVIIGVDLVAIKPIRKVITFQEDIRSDKCKQLIKKELHTWKADCVLNDGSPNVGSAWIQDAFSQAQLTLSALKLACEFLREGGWFITKVFRSKDYQPLLWVFQQLFKKVHSTKPQASRSESAEIFVVCQVLSLLVLFSYFYLLIYSQKGKKAKAEGYTQGDYTLFQTAKVTDFLQAKHPLEVLSAVNEIVFDEEKYSKHVQTTNDIKECCKDVKVLGKTEIKSLLAWHKTLRKEFIEVENEDARLVVKKKLLFSHLDGMDNPDNDETLEFEDDEEADENDELESDSASEYSDNDDENGMDDSEDDEELEFDSDNDEVELTRDEDSGEKNPLLVDLQPEMTPSARANMWFEKDVFKDLENEADEDLEISQMVEEYKKQGGKILGKNCETPSAIGKKGTKRGKKEEGKKMKKVGIDEREGSNSDSDSESESGRVAESAEETSKKRKKKEKVKKLNGFEVVPAEDNAKYLKKLTPEGLALGHKMAFSRKNRRDIIDDGYHRWTFNDEGLPDWFVSEEAMHYQKELPVTKEMVAEYRARMREINARPIKKVAEAKARKKRRVFEFSTDSLNVSTHLKFLFPAARRMKRPPGIKGRYKVVDPRMKKDMRSQKLKEKKSKKAGKKRR